MAIHCIFTAPVADLDLMVVGEGEDAVHYDPNANWPPAVRMPGTRETLGRAAVHLVYTGSKDDFYASKPAGWTVAALQEAQYDPYTDNGQGLPVGVYYALRANFANYLADIPVFDAEGNQTGTERPTVPCPLHTYAGAMQWWWDGTPLLEPPVTEP